MEFEQESSRHRGRELRLVAGSLFCFFPLASLLFLLSVFIHALAEATSVEKSTRST